MNTIKIIQCNSPLTVLDWVVMAETADLWQLMEKLLTSM